MRSFKALYLILALALPIGIFLFLRFFGKNEFEVPPLYEDSVPVLSECTYSYSVPYAIPDSIWQQETTERTSLYLFVFRSRQPVALNRISEQFGPKEVSIHDFYVNPSDSLVLSEWERCFYFLQEPNDLLLVDNERRIRGQYQQNSREEMDRLIMETKIILKKY